MKLGEVLSYKKGVAHIPVFLPAQCPTCNYCPYIRYEEYYKRYSCRLTGEWLLNPMNEIGGGCPVEWEESNESL